MIACLPAGEPPVETPTQQDQGGLSNENVGDASLFSYGGKHWGVPKNFKFPQPIAIRRALHLWLVGISVSATQSIQPSRQLQRDESRTQVRECLVPPGKLRQKFNTQWAQFFNFLENAGLLEGMPRDTTTMTAEQRELTDEKMWSLLKERVSYCFAEGVSGQSRWKLGTWARKVSKSNIVKFGTDSDKSYLDNQTVATRRSAPRPNRKRKTGPSYPHRQKRRIDAGKRSGESLYGRPGLSGAQEAIIEGERRRAEEHGVVPPDVPFAEHDLETPAAHLQWLVDEFGNNRIGRKPVQIQPDGVGRRGRCALPDCQLPTCQLEGGGSHRCRRCGIPVHNPCVEKHGLRDDDDNNFCSEPCMRVYQRNNQPIQFGSLI